MRLGFSVLAASLALAACGGGPTATAPEGQSTIAVSSPAFGPGQPLPRGYTCDGRDLPPPLRWSGVPKDAKQLSVVMRDPDAPGGNFVHWSVTGIPAHVQGLDPGRLPAGAVEGRNDFGTIGYRGPCPPRGGKAHHYVIAVSATKQGNSVLASGRLEATYARR